MTAATITLALLNMTFTCTACAQQDFIDAEGFDGGDGQVGVVGDGDNAMEKFDKRDVGAMDNTVGGRGVTSGASKTNRIDKRWNAWGSGELLIFCV